MGKRQILWLIPVVLFVNGLVAADDNPPYLDKNLPLEKRVDDLLSRMTLEEKVAQMCQFVGLEFLREANKKYTPEQIRNSDAVGFYPGLPGEDVARMVEQGKIGSFLHVFTAEEANRLQRLALKSRLKIPLLLGIDAIHGNGMVRGTTVYPSPITLASAWNPELVREIGRQTALEMRAAGSHWAFTPNVDVARDPRWGRVGETFGEDPYLVSRMGVAMIRGLQTEDFGGADKVIACAKHLAAGSQPVNGLNIAPTDVSERTLREIFLPPYQAAVEAGVFTVMAAHNEVNGLPCHANKWLLMDILRNEFGFHGFIISDWMDIERLASVHHVAKDEKEAYLLTIQAGMDMHMHGPGFFEGVVELVMEGKIPEQRIDQSVRRILEAKFKLGLFENPFVDADKARAVVFSEEHQRTALEAARQGIVLLKNDCILPLDAKKYKKIFITGPNANNETILGDWAMDQPDENVITVAEGVRQLAPEGCQVEYFDSGEVIRRMEDAKIDQAAKLAISADLAIVVVGSNSMRYRWNDKTCGENMDRADLTLAGKQRQLVQAVYRSGTPVVVVLVNGRPLSVNWIDEHIPAVIEAWEPGCFGGQAIAEVLFGLVNPGGKLPVTFPRSVGQIQMIYNQKPSHVYRKYAFEPVTPLYPFGFGLSYTTFEYSNIRLEKPRITPHGQTRVSIDVRNSGRREGDEIVQLYIRDVVSSVTRPVKELKGFERVHLAPGEVKTVSFSITPDQLSFFNAEMKRVVEPGEFKIMIGGSYRDEGLHSVVLQVE